MGLNENEVQPVTYYIPANFEDAGGVLGGKLKTRNCVELACLCGPLAFLEYKLLHFSLQTNIIIAMITLIPLAALCAFGIHGESLSQILMAYIRFRRNRRKLHYEGFTDAQAEKHIGAYNLDYILNNVAEIGLKGALAKVRQKALEDKKTAAPEVHATPKAVPHAVVHGKRSHTAVKQKKPVVAQNQSSSHIKAPPAKSTHIEPAECHPLHTHAESKAVVHGDEIKNKVRNFTRSPDIKKRIVPAAKDKAPSNKWLNSAMKEMLLRKLELGNDDEDV